MKFLKNFSPGMNIMPINFIYHNERNFEEDDALDIVYKDMDSGEVIIETIEKPEIEVWIVKRELRSKYMTSRDYIRMEDLDSFKVRYRYRYAEIAKILGMDKEAVKACPWVLQSNIDIKTFYAIQFRLEYYNEKIKKLNIGLFDIESDTINIDHFPKIAECPTNLISFIDVSNKAVWLFVLRPEGPARTINPKTGKPYDYRDQVDYLEAHQEEFIKECHERFDEIYGNDLYYQILFFDDEMKMTRAFFDLLEVANIDFAKAWNIPYDMGNLLGRPESLGYDPRKVCCSQRFKYKEAYFIPDDNADAHKRKHVCQFSHPTSFVDDLVLYAGIRSGRGRQESLKLSAIAKKELRDDKIDYSEFGDISTAPYENFWLFAIYSLKDSLLLYGLHNKNNDMANLYQRCYAYGLMPNEIFTTTILLTNAIIVDYYENNLIVGNNRNKFKIDNINQFNEFALESDDVLLEEGYEVEVANDEEEEEDDTPASKRKKKFDGALVQNPNRQLSTGFKINGVENSKIHDDLIDEDATSLYPSLMLIMNLSNDTMIGRVIIPYDMEDFCKNILKDNDRYVWDNHELIEGDKNKLQEEYLYNRFPMEGYDFIDDEEKQYKINVSDMFCMMVAGKQWTELGISFFNLPTFSDIEKYLLDEDADIFKGE